MPPFRRRRDPGRLVLLVAGLALALGGSRGAEAQLWRTSLGGGSFAYDVAMDGADVVTAGETAGGNATVVRLDGTTGALVWRHDHPDVPIGNVFYAVAADASGAVIAGGSIRDPGTNNEFYVTKLAGNDGTMLWDYHVPNVGFVSDLRVDATGDVVAVGVAHVLSVVKLSGVDGTELWRYPTDERAIRVRIDSAGDVVVAIDVFLGLKVVKLSGATGAELWTYESSGLVSGLALDGIGDVLIVGTNAGGLGPTADLVVTKIDGAAGTELWQAQVDGAKQRTDFGLDVVADATGDVVAVGAGSVTSVVSTDFLVVKLAGATGSELWRASIDGRARLGDRALGVAVDASGDVVAAGQIARDSPVSGKIGDDLAVVKLAGASGAVVWRQQLDGHAPVGGDNLDEVALALTLDAAGNPVAAGRLADGADTFATVKFDSTTGNDFLFSAKRLRVRDGDNAPARRSISLVSADDRLANAPTAGAFDPTVGGGMLELVNPTSGETATIALPAVGWHAGPAGGYRYEDHHHVGPCSKVFVEPKRIQVSCAGAGIAFSLDEPSQGSLGVRITVGSAGVRRCFLFGGTIKRDQSTGGGSGALFYAKNAMAPADCP